MNCDQLVLQRIDGSIWNFILFRFSLDVLVTSRYIELPVGKTMTTFKTQLCTPWAAVAQEVERVV